MNATINATLSFLAHVISILVRSYNAGIDTATPVVESATKATKAWYGNVRSNVNARIAAARVQA